MNAPITPAEFTASFPIGTPVLYRPIADDPHAEHATIRSEAWALGHGAVVVKITGRAGGVLVSHIQREAKP